MENLQTLQELRDFLSSEMKKISEGVSTPAKGNAVANLGGKWMQSIKLQLEYYKMAGKMPNDNFIEQQTKSVEKIENKEPTRAEAEG